MRTNRRLAISLSHVADVIGIIAAIGLAAGLVGVSAPQTVLAVGLVILTVSATILAGFLQMEVDRLRTDTRSNAADAMPSLAKALGTLASATRARRDAVDPKIVALHLQAACESMTQAFQTTTGHRCRVSILQLYEAESGPAVRYVPERPDRQVRIDYVADNTDFRSVLFEDEDFYFCNDLVTELMRGYQNSHWTEARLKQWESD